MSRRDYVRQLPCRGNRSLPLAVLCAGLLAAAAGIAEWGHPENMSLPPAGVAGTPAGRLLLRDALDLPYAAPQIGGIAEWLNSPPLGTEQLRGKVVLIDFWTYGCINCVRALPYLTAWDSAYRSQGLVIIGIHSPEFAFEKDISSVKAAVAQYDVRYPVALDNHLVTWNNFHNGYWPAHYLIDRRGRVVYTHMGEGGYDILEGNIRYLLGIDKRTPEGSGPKATDDGGLPQDHAPRPVEAFPVRAFPVKVFKDCPFCPTMVAIPAGSFEMGNGKNRHRVDIIQPFALGRYEVTQAEWRAVMGNNPSLARGAMLPVERVSWDDVQEFIARLNRRTGGHYRLPSEAEWEYACRAGSRDEYCGSDNIDRVAWHGPYLDSARGNGTTTHAVGTRQANAFGLHDMSGNVWEWVGDAWHGDYNGAPADGSIWQGDGAKRVIRGGSWLDYPLLARADFRVWANSGKRSGDLGFRLARALPKRHPDTSASRRRNVTLSPPPPN